MASIASLHLYPVKSCAGLTLETAVLGPAGLESQGLGDREWMVVDAGSGEFLTQRQEPRMALIVPAIVPAVVPAIVPAVLPAIAPGQLLLNAPGMPALCVALDDASGRAATLAVQVWNHACHAIDEGEAVAAWLSRFLGRPLRLARFAPAHRRPANREWTGAVEALNRFSDGYPVLMISTASLADLNRRLGEAGREALPMNRFRPNIVLGGVEAFDEDRFASLACGPMVLRPVKACPRCPIPSIDQATGSYGPDPLDILVRYRDHPTLGVVFGQNVVVAAGVGSSIAIGQELATEWNF